MNATRNTSPTSRFATARVLAALLEKLERSEVPVDAGQYGSVVEHLKREFADAEPGAGLNELLDAYPAAAELYENLNYQYAGLCRSGLDASLAAERRARDAIGKAMHRPAGELN